jgi:hypothetical protein
MPVTLVEQLDDTDAAGNQTFRMQATFTVGTASSPMQVSVPMTGDWASALIAAIEDMGGKVNAVLSLGI